MLLLIKKAVIINSKGVRKEPQDILIEKGVITKIGKISEPEAKVIEANGKYVLPGFIDLHCHLREPGFEHKETIETGSRSAAKGGFTTIVCMPNTNPVLDNAKVIEGVLKEAKRVGLVHVLPAGAVTKGQKGEELSDMMELKEAGCIALSDDGKAVQNSQLMRCALEYSKMAGLIIMEHCEDATIARGMMNEGFYSTLLGLKGIPEIAETIIVARDIELAKFLKTRIHFSHISTKRSIDLIRQAKAEGVAVTAEACPHHFSLTEEALKDFDTNMKVNPPLRTKEDVEAVKLALKDGTLDCISTDHAPHALDEKELEFDAAPMGMIGFETALGLAGRELIEKKYITWSTLVEKMSANPAKILGLDNKGEIAEGKDADLVMIDPDKEWFFRKEEIVSKAKNSPFIDEKLKGRVELTICGGKVTYEL